MKDSLLCLLPPNCPWKDRIHYYNCVDSTNNLAKDLAKNGAPEGTVVVAGCQTGGRGRLGRSFQSPNGMGVYLSVILRPNCPPEQLMHLTCAVAVKMCDAVEAVANIRPGIKWTNDLVYQNRKLGGILTELFVENGVVKWAIVGVGINCLQALKDFPEDLQALAVSLAMVTQKVISPASLAAAMLTALWQMDLQNKSSLMEAYRRDCITVKREVVLLLGDTRRYGTALGVDDDGGLLVAFQDGSTETVTAGEISVRGLYGYC